MKKLILSLASVATLAFLAGCASKQPHGTIYSEYTVDAGAIVYQSSAGVDVSKLKMGKSSAKGFLGIMVAIGDASVTTAAKNGGIKTVRFVDWKVKSICGIVEEYDCIVWGD